MKLGAWHRERGDEVFFTRNVRKSMFEGEYDRVYGSAIFTFSTNSILNFREEWPAGILGGTGVGEFRTGEYPTVEQFLGVDQFERYDYSLYPEFTASIGFTQRGCRLACGFCIVPKKEGRPKSVSTIPEIWRGEGHPKHLVLLDNDFFGQPRAEWEARIAEILAGDFKVSFNQGINIRLIDADAAKAIGSVKYYDDQFKTRRIYTAWDNLKDEAIFTRGVEHLIAAGVRPRHIMVYMLVGYAKDETIERVFYRFNKMVDMGLLPYPMVYNNANPLLKKFQRFVIRRQYKLRSWEEYLNADHPERMKMHQDSKRLMDLAS